MALFPVRGAGPFFVQCHTLCPGCGEQAPEILLYQQILVTFILRIPCCLVGGWLGVFAVGPTPGRRRSSRMEMPAL